MDPIHSDIPEIKLPEGGFRSDIPPVLLKDCTDEQKYILQSIGEIKHYVAWSAPIITQTNHEVRKTNGRVTKNSKDIEEIKESQKELVSIAPDLKQLVGTKRLLEKLGSSKFTWIGGAVFCIGVITIVKNDNLRGVFLSWLGI